MDARTENETLFVGVPESLQRGRTGVSDFAVEDNVSGQRKGNEARISDRNVLKVQATRLNTILADLLPAERLARFRNEIDGKLVFTTSFGLEDQVILHMIADIDLDVDVVTLDTGRLFSQTYELWVETERRYGRRIRAFYPQQDRLEALI